MTTILLLKDSNDMHRYISFNIEGPFTTIIVKESYETEERFRVSLIDIDGPTTENNIIDKWISKTIHPLLFTKCENALSNNNHIKLAGYTFTLTSPYYNTFSTKYMRIADEQISSVLKIIEETNNIT